MRNNLGILFTFISILALFGCDKLIDESGDFAVGPHGARPSCESEGPPHPYLSCVAPAEQPDPACLGGCGGWQEEGEPLYAFCIVPCEDDSDCLAWDPGGSVASCDGTHCNWFCDEDHLCPSGLECVDRLCYAPDLLGP